jgi:hypothetical protein
VGNLRPSDVRTWHANLLSSGVGPVKVAKAYRLLRTVLGTAVTDGMLAKSPPLEALLIAVVIRWQTGLGDRLGAER